MLENFFEAFLILSFGSVAITGQDLQCFVPGECVESSHLGSSGSVDEFECLETCQSEANCTWFTYYPNVGVCQLLSSCNKLDVTYCKDCLSGQVQCSRPEPVCWVSGECRGNISHIVTEITSEENCLNTCKQSPDCDWFTYIPTLYVCLLLHDCPTLDQDCSDCLSGESRCEFRTKAYSKIIVAVGTTKNGFTNNVEVLDLENPGMICEDLPGHPLAVYGAAIFLNFDQEPEICGGSDGQLFYQECYKFSDNNWKLSYNMTTGRCLAGNAKNPFLNESVEVARLSGGLNEQGRLNSEEIRARNGWISINETIPTKMYWHCMSYVNPGTIILIGGNQLENFSQKTHLLTNEGSWSVGPDLQYGRSSHSCSRIREHGSSQSFSIIVVGGFNNGGNYLSSVEILDEGASSWRSGPELPFAISGSTLVEDPNGSVMLVGGYSESENYLTTIFKLEHAGPDQKWVEMNVKLKTGRFRHSVTYIPDEATNCTLNKR